MFSKVMPFEITYILRNRSERAYGDERNGNKITVRRRPWYLRHSVIDAKQLDKICERTNCIL